MFIAMQISRFIIIKNIVHIIIVHLNWKPFFSKFVKKDLGLIFGQYLWVRVLFIFLDFCHPWEFILSSIRFR